MVNHIFFYALSETSGFFSTNLTSTFHILVSSINSNTLISKVPAFVSVFT
ncbi:MAG: hypothetical protein LBF15_02135 [Candidatus Peribacteria bacterium]|nr:hypothetical protein [Candidatus Peribacteria bacterium]